MYELVLSIGIKLHIVSDFSKKLVFMAEVPFDFLFGGKGARRTLFTTWRDWLDICLYWHACWYHLLDTLRSPILNFYSLKKITAAFQTRESFTESCEVKNLQDSWYGEGRRSGWIYQINIFQPKCIWYNLATYLTSDFENYLSSYNLFFCLRSNLYCLDFYLVIIHFYKSSLTSFEPLVSCSI